MKKKIEKLEKAILPIHNQVRVDTWDEAYRQINIISFRQNFKLLIGHYKNDQHATRNHLLISQL